MILRGNVFSQALEMETGISVLVPNETADIGKYKVVYLLHGLTCDANSYLDNTMLPYYANGCPAIFIMPQVGRSFYTDMVFGQKYFTYVAEELPQIVKRVFNISAVREDIIIMGASMGGYGALKAALTKPDSYGMCCAFASGCLFLKDYLGLQKSMSMDELIAMFGEQYVRDFQSIFGPELTWKPEYELLELVKGADKQRQRPAIYMSCGREDPFIEYNTRFANELKNSNFDFTFEQWPGGHDWVYFNEALRRALQFVFTAN